MQKFYIKTEPLQFLTIKELTISSQMNAHGTAKISGYIADEAEQECVSLLSQEVWERIIQTGSAGEEETLFWGVVTSFSIETIQDQKKMTLELTTGSFYMDITKPFRTFQDNSITYREIFEKITASYHESGIIMNKALDDSPDSFILQHNETDWAFLQRLASKYGSFLVPDRISTGVKYFVDLPKGAYRELPELSKYKVKMSSADFYGFEYSFESRENYQLGDQINIEGKQYFIYRIDSQYIRSEMLHSCYLRTPDGMKTTPLFEETRSGCSFSATVLQVKEDKVQVKVYNDENEGQRITQWYPFATVYSAPDGTGWYCMPEIGDTVRLHIPSSNEREAYVISAVHLETGSSDRKNPDYKIIKNKYQKEIRFTPDAIVLTNNQGTKIELTDSSGISIVSQQDVSIKAMDNLILASENGSLTAAGTKAVTLKQRTTSIDIEDGILFKGGELKVQ